MHLPLVVTLDSDLCWISQIHPVLLNNRSEHFGGLSCRLKWRYPYRWEQLYEISGNVENKINSRFKESAMYQRIWLFSKWSFHFIIFSVFLFINLLQNNCHLSMCREKPILYFDISARAGNFNRCSLILFLLLIKRHFSYKMWNII